MDVSEGRDYDFDYEGYDVEKTKRSLRAHGANKQTHFNHIENAYRLAKDAPSQEAADSMEGYYEAYKRTQRAIEQAWGHLLEIDPSPENEAAMMKALNDLAAERMDMDQRAMHVFGLCRPVNKDDKVTPQKEETCKPNQALKPEELTATSKPTEFTAWMERLRTYYSSSKMQHASMEEQHQYVYACISPELRARVKPKVTRGTPIFKSRGNVEESMEEKLTQEFRTLYPLTTRRFEWLNQKMSSTWASYYARMQEYSDAADVSGMKADDFMAFALIIGTPDGEMKNEMLRLQAPTPEALDRIGQSYDRTGATKAQLGGASSTPAKAFAAQQRPNPGRQGPPVERVRPDLVDKCKRCGVPLTVHESQDCPKKKEKCFLCKKTGHIAAVCIKSAQKEQRASARAISAPSQAQPQQWPATSQYGASAAQPAAAAPQNFVQSAYLPYNPTPASSVYEAPRANVIRGPNAPTPALGL